MEGKDVIALRRRAGEQDERLLIECKHWKDHIHVSAVRNLIGVAVTEKENLPTGIILATTSTFTSDARKVTIHPSIAIDLKLKDSNDIISWIGDYNAIRLTPEEVQLSGDTNSDPLLACTDPHSHHAFVLSVVDASVWLFLGLHLRFSMGLLGVDVCQPRADQSTLALLTQAVTLPRDHQRVTVME